MVTEDPKITRRRFLKAFGLGLAGLSTTGFLTYLFGSSRALDILNTATPSSSPAFQPFTKFRINSVEETPHVDLNQYRLIVDGLVKQPVKWSFSELKQSLTEVEQISDFHCVEGWGVKNVRWTGIKMKELLETVKPKPTATHLTFYSLGGVYTESLSLDEAAEDETLLAYGLYGKPLPRQQGFPLRVIIPRMYGYKGAKWLHRIEFTDHQHLGYWEQYGYNVDGVTPPR
ncbi:hypothetical protein GCM10011571_00010 [Marinithermofilum abyssi]|uniref:Oxidoreductase molybdopterin-binding domain-containing protein n=1 Tax=Marinithermofilum abyssi TaxID=1571185 RepID=A0A8J2YC11_9BACL|nr:molybdopterin-dependent oxidoreductase [Marinithermofilum abyssi]GGE03209.1 hypothetical protein GCM10011571_00010 [Marinithermofilum abyssi]